MTIENALPAAGESAEVSVQQHDADAHKPTDHEAHEGGHDEGESESGEQSAKKEKTPEQREIDRLRRAVDRKTRQLYEARSAAPQRVAETQAEQPGKMQSSQNTDEPLTLSRSELDKLINQRAEQLAPTIRQQQTEIEHRRGVVDGLAKEWGTEKFDRYSSDLDDAFGGLTDAKGHPKPATEAIFESAMPARLIEYLADPDNADEAEQIGRMSQAKAGVAIGRLEAKLEAAKAKPQRSNAAAPIEQLKGAGKTSSGMPDPSNVKAYVAWANKQDKIR